MKTLFVCLFAALAMGFAIAEPGTSETPVPTAFSTKNVSPDEAETLMKNSPKLIVLDVRTPEEFASGHIPGAKNVDFFSNHFDQQVAALDAASPLLVHCAAGGRSAQAVKKLEALKKFGVIYHLKDGFNGWTAAKKPVEGKPADGK